MNTAKSLKIALINREKKQVWLAKELGVERQQISNWCNGQGIKTTTLETICELLDYKVSKFISLGE